jgi:heat shock protein beta
MQILTKLKQIWEVALPQLKTDPRFTNSPLTLNHQLQMFQAHIAHLSAKHINNLHMLFESHSPSLATSFTSLPISSLQSSPPSIKLGYDATSLEREYSKWQRERFQQYRKAFDEMLAENSFVEFWGRLGKIGGEGIDGGVKADEMGAGEGEGGGGTVDMKALARNVDIHDMEKVIKVRDSRIVPFQTFHDRQGRQTIYNV